MSIGRAADVKKVDFVSLPCVHTASGKPRAGKIAVIPEARFLHISKPCASFERDGVQAHRLKNQQLWNSGSLYLQA